MNRIIDLHKFRTDAFLSLMTDQYLKITYSQNGEDTIICALLSRIKSENRGIYVDVGCFHPRSFSNTFFLYYSGWRGINIDANQTSIDAFNIERTLDKNVCCAVGLEDGQCDFFVMEPMAASTINKETAQRCQEFGWKLLETRQVPVRTLTGLLDEHVADGTPIDLLDIDLEGMDEAVVTSLDMKKYRPRIISAEIQVSNALEIANTEIYKALTCAGYRLHSIFGGTFIFTDESVFHNG